MCNLRRMKVVENPSNKIPLPAPFGGLAPFYGPQTSAPPVQYCARRIQPQ